MVNATNSSRGISAPDLLVYDFGPLVNNPNTKNTTFTVKGIAQLLDVAANTNGALLTVVANYSYADSTGRTSYVILTAPVVIVVVSPILSITKTGRPRTSIVQAGTIVDYTVLIQHTTLSSSPAFEVQFNDSMSPLVTLLPGTVHANGAVVQTGNNPSDTTVAALLSPNLPIGQNVIIITYSANLTTLIYPNTIVYSNATVAWLPWESKGLYVRSATSIGGVTTTQEGPLSVALSATSLPETSGNTANVGETLVMSGTISLIEGTVANATMTIQMPLGKFAMLSASVVNMMPLIVSQSAPLLSNGSVIVPTDYDHDGTADTAIFNFGTLVNSAGFYSIQVSVTALVLNVAGNIYPNQPLTTASFTFNNLVQTYTLNSLLAIQVVEPVISITVSAHTFGPAEGGATVQYTLTVRHAVTSTAAAYLLTIIAPLSSQESLVPGTVSATSTSGTVLVVSSGVYVNVTLLKFGSSQSITVTYNTTLTTNVIANTAVSSSVGVSYFSAPDDSVCFCIFSYDAVLTNLFR